MAIPEMAHALQALSISDPEYLLFCPTGQKAGLREKFDDIPRYLFRVFTPKSRGTTDQSWTKSMDATEGTRNSRVDIFAREDDEKVASMLTRHLWWWEGSEDNFVSWTSSLLFALVYVFHLHANNRDRSAFDNIHLCIIDTTKFLKGTFLRDIDLIEAYYEPKTKLEELKSLRSGNFYFGEYLSQGALKIEDKCRIVSAQAMIDMGLYDLRPEFEKFSHWEKCENPSWAKEVVALRRFMYQIEDPDDKLRIAIEIAQLFGPYWRLPMAANLGTLLPPSVDDITIAQAFRVSFFTDDDRENSSQQFIKFMRAIYQDFCVRKLGTYINEAETHLRCAVRFATTQSLVHQDPVLLDSISKALKGRLDMEATVSQQLRDIIGS